MLFRTGIFLLLLALTCQKVAAAPLKLVGTEQVEKWDGEIVTELNCVISTSVSRDLAAFSGAKLSYIAPVGKSFVKGDLLAKQEDYFLAKELERLTVELKVSELDAKFHEKEHQRLEKMASGLVSPSQLNQHKLNMHKALLTIERLKNQIEEQKELVGRLSFYAQSNGQVIKHDVAVGSFVNRSQDILSYYLENEKEISCQSPINTNTYEVVDLGRFSLLKGEPLEVKRFGKNINRNSQNRTVFLAIPAQFTDTLEVGRRLKVNQSRSLNSDNTLSKLPSDALTMSSKGKYVWQVSSEGVLSKVDVKVVSNLTGYFLVESGLKAGDMVVTVGKGGLKPEQKVAFNQREATNL